MPSSRPTAVLPARAGAEPAAEPVPAQRFQYLFEANGTGEGKSGSFYLQSKAFRAKERIEEEFLGKGGGSSAEPKLGGGGGGGGGGSSGGGEPHKPQ